MDKISKISLTVSIIGILILLIINNAQDYKITKISSIDSKIINKNVKIIGNSSNIRINQNNFTVFKIKDKTGEIKIICECPDIKENAELEIIGKLVEYKEELEIQAEKIKIYKSP